MRVPCHPVDTPFFHTAPMRFRNVVELNARPAEMFAIFEDGESWLQAPRRGLRGRGWMMARMFLALAAAVAMLAAPSAAVAQAAPSNPARAALAALERQADALFATAAKRDWSGAKIAVDGAKGAVDVLRTQRFEGAYADAGGRMEALYAARHRLDAAVADADIALGAADGPSAMRSANRLTEIVWQLGAPIGPPLMQQAQHLAFLARKLEYAHAVGDKVLYAETVAEVRRLWSGFRPSLATRKPPPDLAPTDAAVARLGSGGREDAEAVRRLGAAAQSLRATLGG
jgi:hypothetical protein